MHDGLLSQGQPACEQMRVGVAGQQHALEKQQTGGPHAGRAAEPRQDVFADEWLDLEQEERPSENGEAVGCHLAGGGTGPNLFRTTQDPSQFFEAVAAGTDEGTTMPAFGSLLTPEQIWEVYAFVVFRDGLE